MYLQVVGGSAVPVAWDCRMQMKGSIEPIAKAGMDWIVWVRLKFERGTKKSEKQTPLLSHDANTNRTK